MAFYKTVLLSGEEQQIKIGGQNCDIRNDGVDTVYISSMPSVEAGTDGVLAVPAGQAAKLLDCKGAVYMTGTGTVQLCGNDYSESVFKTAATFSGDGGVDQTARAAINSHAGNTGIHLTTKDAVDAAASVAINPNLLINPDFHINQRDQLEYGSVGYTVDGWKLTSLDSSVELIGNHLCLINKEATPSHPKTLTQYIENYHEYRGKTLTFSVTADVSDATCAVGISDGVNVSSVAVSNGMVQVTKQISEEASELRVYIQLSSSSAGYVTVYNTKLELGSNATPYAPPEPVTEMLKCQRYYQTHSIRDVPYVDLRPLMRKIPVVTEITPCFFGYSAEI